MRRAQKRKILDLIFTIDSAQLESYDLAVQGNHDAACGLLADCQDGIVNIGTIIEEAEGEDHEVVKMLEEFCELLYECSVVLQNQEDFDEQYSNLKIKIEIIAEAVKADIPGIYEAVFLPYKACMWDSLESVWMTARDDPECDAYVIPIPYFDRNADLSLGEMHYEGDLYPDYVPITDWRAYSIEKRKPDIIFIHNPYDDVNTVTTIHPHFYADILREHTNMLVYIPYFVCLDDVEEHFCDTPGVFYSDKVIMESQKVRDTYMRVLREFEENNQCKGLFGNLNKKFPVLGSPKYDKVRSTACETIEVPDAWRRLIYRSSESRKRVIFYNTTLSTLLRYDGKALEKIKNVLRIFKNNEEVVLLWRPHPLNEKTVASMRPKLLQEYRDIIQGYKMEKWGIYDDTPELHRSIAISDAYYGDWSSVVALYRITGKPIMIENLNV